MLNIPMKGKTLQTPSFSFLSNSFPREEVYAATWDECKDGCMVHCACLHLPKHLVRSS